ncbi:nitrogen fixation protein FixH [Piscinibacter terrae]|uniref:Nitrogen fixation protein FixH n=1 Tax=Piscinibacter terrae TaxID=2496871 RepID=A0A3N7K1V4_9BURK|nr:nitrogen fixation protein FixH [Albitalea terrae]RQP24935.1 nitrogen fixation protein FixH [Albitalea terrae]
MNARIDQPVLPWWRVPMVWLVVGGPAVVVAASFATLVLAVRGGDVPLHEETVAQRGHEMPATQARNHAAAPRR